MTTSSRLAIPSQTGWAWPYDYIPGHWRFFGVCLICEGGPVAGDPAHQYVRCMRCGRAHWSEGEDGLTIEIAIAHLDRFPPDVAS